MAPDGSNSCFVGKRDFKEPFPVFKILGSLKTFYFWSTKVGFLLNFYVFSNNLSYNQKTTWLTKLTIILSKSWPKNLSNKYIYAEQNSSRTQDIGFQSWPLRSQKRLTFSLKFWLWRQVPENWQATRDFMLWFFLSWGINYRTKNSKTKSKRMTSWTFNHPISHCVCCKFNITNNIDLLKLGDCKKAFDYLLAQSKSFLVSILKRRRVF